MAASNGSMLLAGYTFGSFASTSSGAYAKGAVVVLRPTPSDLVTSPSPLRAPSPPPETSPSPAPTPVPIGEVVPATSQDSFSTNETTALVASVAAVLVLSALCVCLLKRGMIARCCGKEKEARSGVGATPETPSRSASGVPWIERIIPAAAKSKIWSGPYSGRIPAAAPTPAGQVSIQAHRHATPVASKAVTGTAAGPTEYAPVGLIPADGSHRESGGTILMPARSAMEEEEKCTGAEVDRDFAQGPWHDVETDATARPQTERTNGRATGPGVLSPIPGSSTPPSASNGLNQAAVVSRGDAGDPPAFLCSEGQQVSRSPDTSPIGGIEAVLESFERTARSSPIPVISELAMLGSELIRHVVNHAGNLGADDWRGQWFRSFLVILQGAEGLLGTVRGFLFDANLQIVPTASNIPLLRNINQRYGPGLRGRFNVDFVALTNALLVTRLQPSSATLFFPVGLCSGLSLDACKAS